MRNYLLSLLLASSGLAAAQTPVSFVLQGQIGQLSAPAKVYLLKDGEFKDSAALQKGAFTLRGTTDVPKGAVLYLQRNGRVKDVFSGPSDVAWIFLSQGTINFSGRDSLTTARITGPPLTTDYQRLQTSLLPVRRRENALGAEYQRASAAERQTPAFEQRMEARRAALTAQREQLYAAFIKANPASWVSLNALTQIGGPNPSYPVVASLYALLSPTLQQSATGKQYGELLQQLKAVAVGAPAPAFTQPTPEGKAVSLTDYRGKYLLIDFWASWCGPCRAENPNVVRAYNAFKGRNFEVLSISLDDEAGREKWLKAIQEDALPWPQAADLHGWQNAAARSYFVRGIPQNFLIGPDGKIVAANLRGAELHTVLSRYLK